MRVALSAFISALALGAHAPAASAMATCRGPSEGWKTTRTNPDIPVNLIVLNRPGKPPTWNGAVVTDKQARGYVEATAKMNPIPVIVLVVSPGSDCKQVAAYRKMASETLPCGQGKCVEIDP